MRTQFFAAASTLVLGLLTPVANAQPAATGPFAQASRLPFEAPDFAHISDGDYQPAIEQGIAIEKAEIETIANNPDAPTFANTIEAMERAGQMLRRVDMVFAGVVAANTNPTLDKADTATSPQLAALQDAILLNPRLFARVKALHDNEASLNLAPDQRMLLDITFARFAHEGALLGPADKEKLKAINERISTLQTKFSQKLTAATKDGALVVDNVGALKGLSPAALADATRAAAMRNLAPGHYVIPMQNTTLQPAMSDLADRATRQALFDASWTRAEKGGANDTRADVADLALLRAQKAALLGYRDYASYVLYDQMAKTPATAMAFMQGLVPALAAEERREAADINAEIASQHENFKVRPWDWDRYANLVRTRRLAYDEAAVKPYFEIHRVLEDGVFYAANQLYGLTFKKRDDLPVYQPDVTTYTVYDADGTELALFYFDPWKRDNKQGGAWEDNFVGQSTLLGQKPVIYNVENFAKPADGQPALIAFDDVTTMFHEFGHALHGMLSNQRYPSIAGTQTARDFVEFPSQFNENWATDAKVLAHYARHYQTGAPLPQALADKLRQTRSFGQGYALGEATTAAMLDMAWHSLPASAGKQDVDAFEAKALSATGLDVDDVPPRYRSSYFRHIWANDYAAGYYAYGWTEMLDHDAFAWFTAHGGLTRTNGQRFREMVLSKGHSEDYAAMFHDFTGHDPSVEPMLEARGLTK
ncbi:MAG: M3 family metallopeptidase [Pseudomonadota bacterium]|nr:M3 family metallopeptidase [Pseudomonadota bacterium]